MWCQANLHLKLNSALRHERNNNFVKTKQCASSIFLPYSLHRQSEKKNASFMLNLQSQGKKCAFTVCSNVAGTLLITPLRESIEVYSTNGQLLWFYS